ncbi:alpha-L-fucosidase [Streptomyces sp. FIT100]|uniref:alpha-L-fucosidase n=1 Tax=Streptomyces sp. FIT100 TaxID=2837956 RepID=UPI0021CA1BF5|nr:alpha-L-fucosidase [Streptomyces sp. FIT100]UUN24984.1 alpha-L-fucosidase [Streptomyces sp. FIT100]
MTTQSWFAEAKLGIFVHWGISSVRGMALPRSSLPGQISYEEYMEQLHGFTAARYSPDAWAELFARAGAKYAVMTAKDHDGMALWDTASTDLSVVRVTPARKDLVRPFARALRRRGLRVGLYFSHHGWSHGPYTATRRSQPHREAAESESGAARDHDEDRRTRERLVRAANRAQVRELVENYRPDLLWFDGAREHGRDQWRADDWAGIIPALGPETVVIGRTCGHGDHDTPELGTAIVPSDGSWELCYPLGGGNSHQPAGAHHPSVRELISVFADTIAGGGNLLLKTSPQEDGTIPPADTVRLTGLGQWIRRNREAVYTTTGLPYGYFDGPSTLAKDRRTLFLICARTPHGLIELRGLHNTLRRVSVLSTGLELPYHVTEGLPDWNIPRVIRIKPPIAPSVLALELHGELELHRNHR